MADLDHVRHLERLRDDYVHTCDDLVALSHRVAEWCSDCEGYWRRNGDLLEQFRDRAVRDLNRVIDAELRR